MKFVEGWVDTAKEYNLMQNSMPREGYKPTHLVLHGTAGGTYGNDVIAYMETAGVSTHFVISVDGTIWQAVDCSVAAYANAPLMSPRINFDHADVNPNYWTISIEFCKPDTTNTINISDDQFKSGSALVALICDTYNIPRRAGDGHGGIIGHCDLNSVERSMCPGTFPWGNLWKSLVPTQQQVPTEITGLENSGVFTTASSDFKNYFQVSGSFWHCIKTGFNVGGNIQKFIADLSLDGQQLPLSGLPTSNEIHVAGTQSDVIQHFEHFSVRYAPSLKAFPPSSKYLVYVMNTSDPLLQTPIPDTTALKNTIASLQGKITQIAVIAKL